MAVLSHLNPKKFFQFFEEICGIPHGSSNVEAISDYLVDFARKRQLEVIQDHVKNVIIIKEASKGYEQEPPVILQGHMDMVAVHKPNLDIDMTKDPLKLVVDGDKVYADGTSLGGDDGIAVAYAMAILDDDTLQHPRLEVVITVDEETGMVGAREIDLSMLKGKRMLNLDSETEGVFLTSCAGGAKVRCGLEFQPVERTGYLYEIAVNGLQGGHSGGEIHKERGNANLLIARFLWNIIHMDPGLVSCQGGLADNAIPRETVAQLIIPEEKQQEFMLAAETFSGIVQSELAARDPGFQFRVEMKGIGQDVCVAGADLKKAVALLLSLPNGVQAMSADMPGLVETSLNLGILTITAQSLQADYAVRSSIESRKEALLKTMEAVCYLAGASYSSRDSYPGWAYRVNSPLRDKMIAVYEEMYGEKPKVDAVHAGLECGLLASKIEDLDCVALGPNAHFIHTTEEYLSIVSVARVWEYLIRLLARKG